MPLLHQRASPSPPGQRITLRGATIFQGVKVFKTTLASMCPARPGSAYGELVRNSLALRAEDLRGRKAVPTADVSEDAGFPLRRSGSGPSGA